MTMGLAWYPQYHNTYLHAGPRPGVGWPVDHTVEDTFELPPKINARVEGAEHYASEAQTQAAFLNSPVFTPAVLAKTPETFDAAEEYRAEYTHTGGVALVLTTTKLVKRTIATFDTFADAQTAAEALNNHKGY